MPFADERYMFSVDVIFLSRPNCFQIVIQHFSEEQYIFYFAGETPEQAQVHISSTYYYSKVWGWEYFYAN